MIHESSVEHLSPGWLSVSPSTVGRCLVVAVAGEADSATAGQLRGQLLEALGSCPEILILDLSGLTFCSLHGLDALHDAIDVAEQAGTDVRMLGMSAQLSWLHRTFPTYVTPPVGRTRPRPRCRSSDRPHAWSEPFRSCRRPWDSAVTDQY